MHRQNIQPEALAQRVVDGRVLYSHVVVVEGQRLIFGGCTVKCVTGYLQ